MRNVVQYDGPGYEYEAPATALDGAERYRGGQHRDGAGPLPAGAAMGPPSANPAPATAEHGRGLKIIDAVTDNLQLTGNGRAGTTVQLEKALSWLPGAGRRAPVQHPFLARPRVAAVGGPGSAGAEGCPHWPRGQHLRAASRRRSRRSRGGSSL